MSFQSLGYADFTKSVFFAACFLHDPQPRTKKNKFFFVRGCGKPRPKKNKFYFVRGCGQYQNGNENFLPLGYAYISRVCLAIKLLAHAAKPSDLKPATLTAVVLLFVIQSLHAKINEIVEESSKDQNS